MEPRLPYGAPGTPSVLGHARIEGEIEDGSHSGDERKVGRCVALVILTPWLDKN